MQLRHRRSVAAVLALAVVSTAHADDLFWQGGTFNLTDANYYNANLSTPNKAPVSGNGDILYIGEDGTANHASTDLTIGKLYVGHNAGGGSTEGLPGPGTVNVTGGSITTTAGASGSASAGIIVGNQNPGTLTVDGASTTVTSNQLLVVGYGDNTSQSATLTITNGATVKTNAGDINVGDTAGGGTGIAGHVNVNGGNLNVASRVRIGLQASGSSFAQTAGATTTTSSFAALGDADNVTFSVSGGTYNGTGFTAASGTSGSNDNTAISFSGSATAVFTGSMLIATGVANHTSLTITDDASVSVQNNLVFADNNSTATDTSLTISGNGHLTITGPTSNFFLGRAASSNTTLTMTGGLFTLPNRFLMAPGTNATGVVVNHSAGTTNIGNDLRVGDTGGTATYNLSGSAVLNAAQGILVGRQKSLSVINQTGGTATVSGGTLRIGDSENADTATYSTGTYNLSGGSLSVTPAAGSTLTYTMTVGANGTGTMRMTGDDGSLTVNGNLLVRSTSPAIGTLAFQLEAGDASISPVTTTGFTTLDPASVVALEFNGLAPTQGLFTVLNSSDITNNGAIPSMPAGWAAQIVPGGNGKLFQFFAGDLNGDGALNADDYALLDRNNAKHLTGGANGDFNADGSINAADYQLIDQAYASQHPQALADPSFLAARADQFGDAYVASLLASVPEPSLLVPLAACLPVLPRRRRPRN